MTQRVQPRIALLAAVAALAGAIIALQVAGRTDTAPVTRGQWGAAAAVARAANMSIPPIFHHIFIADEAAEKMGLRFDEEGLVSQKPWIRSCKYMYQDAGANCSWQGRAQPKQRQLGDTASGESAAWDVALAAAYLTCFLFHWAAQAVEKSDAFRYILMHKFGGEPGSRGRDEAVARTAGQCSRLYQDGDIECWRFGGDMLAGADVVVQASGGSAGHFEHCCHRHCRAEPRRAEHCRAEPRRAEHYGSARARVCHSAHALLPLPAPRAAPPPPPQRTHSAEGVTNAMTGPRLLRDALVKWGLTPNKHGDYEHTENDVHGVRVKMYPAGQWLTPCQFWEQECRVNVQLRRANGTQDLTHELCSSGEKKEGGRSLLCGRRPLSAGGSSGGGRGGGSSSWTRRLAEAVAQAFR
eukprot:scaffold10.g2347.t1